MSVNSAGNQNFLLSWSLRFMKETAPSGGLFSGSLKCSQEYRRLNPFKQNV